MTGSGMIPDAVHVYEQADIRGLRTAEPWCVTAVDGKISSTTRHRTRDEAEEVAAQLAGTKP